MKIPRKMSLQKASAGAEGWTEHGGKMARHTIVRSSPPPEIFPYYENREKSFEAGVNDHNPLHRSFSVMNIYLHTFSSPSSSVLPQPNKII